MEKLLVKVFDRQKAYLLVELLKSMDFVDSVEYVTDIKTGNEPFTISKYNDDSEHTGDNSFDDDFNLEIKQYRLEKKVLS